jgi:hypothetical protein
MAPGDVTRYTDDRSEEDSDGDFDVTLPGSVLTALPVPCRLGDYEVQELIGSGGMGQVYRAEHVRMARPVALKTLRPDLVANGRAVERFYREVRAAARVIHPHLVVAFDAGVADGVHYLAMELMAGKTLWETVAQGGPLGETEAVRIVCQAAWGLKAAHDAGVIHRDVKPSNLMLLEDGTVKVLDLGLATMSSDTPDGAARGKLIGTIEYMAPEQMENPDGADKRSDVYSLGATFFFLLVGRSPYEGSLLEQARALRDAPPPELYRFRQDADLRLDQIVRRMLAKRPEDRFQSMQEVIDELSPLLNSVSDVRPTGERMRLNKDATSASSTRSTSSERTAVLGIDLGMYYAAATIGESGGKYRTVAVGGAGRPLLRCALADQEEGVLIGEEAIRLRTEAPERVTHSLQYYLGRPLIDRPLSGKRMPPEVWLAMLLSQLQHNIHQQRKRGEPQVMASAISLPACYDQLHRRCILRAANIAGLPEPRLVDRPLAAACSQLHPEIAALPAPASTKVCHWLVVSVAGNAMEVTAVRHLGGRFQVLASCGSTGLGIPAWHQRLIDLIANDCRGRTGADPRKQLKSAAALQVACEQALRRLLLSTQTDLRFPFERKQISVSVTRDTVKVACHDLLEQLRQMLEQTMISSEVPPEKFDRCLLLGVLARFPAVVKTVRRATVKDIQVQPVDHAALAMGVSMAAGPAFFGDATQEFSQSCLMRDIGIVVQREGEKRKAITVLPRHTLLPTQTTRRMRWASGKAKDSLAIVESATWNASQWQSLGAYRPTMSLTGESGELVLSVNESGLLEARLRDPASGHQERIGPLPYSSLSAEDERRWRNHVDGLVRRE